MSAFDEDAASSNSSSHGVRHPPLGWPILRAAFIAEETDRLFFTVQGAHSNWVTIFRLIRSRNLHFGTVWFLVWFFSVETHGKNPPKKPLEMDGKQLTGHCFNKKKKIKSTTCHTYNRMAVRPIDSVDERENEIISGDQQLKMWGSTRLDSRRRTKQTIEKGI